MASGKVVIVSFALGFMWKEFLEEKMGRVEQRSCSGYSPKVEGRTQTWLSCTVLSPNSEPATVYVVVVVKLADSQHSLKRLGGQGEA